MQSLGVDIPKTGAISWRWATLLFFLNNVDSWASDTVASIACSSWFAILLGFVAVPVNKLELD